MKKISEGIVLGHIKYSDNRSIVHIYTKDEGRASYILAIPKSNNRHKVLSAMLPLSQVEICYLDSGTEGMRRAITIRLTKVYTDLRLDVVKGSISLFIAEFLEKCLKHNIPDDALYQYIESSLDYFDELDKYSNFHIEFLCGLCDHFGIRPGDLNISKDTNTVYWDFQEGNFVELMPSHSNFLDAELSATACRFFVKGQAPNINLERNERNRLLQALVKYYSIHLDGVSKIKSLEILQEVFA
ncbi:MAG: DNA repair protein RecO [Bacteroidales bacterium]